MEKTGLAYGKPVRARKVTISVTPLEAALIQKIRDVKFGQITVHKNNGVPTRVVIGKSELLDEKDGMEISENIVD